MTEVLNDLTNKIMESDQLVLVLVVAEECVEEKTTIQSEIEILLGTHDMDYKLYVLCLDENHMPWPRPLTQALYFFSPKNLSPLFHRTGRPAISTFVNDVELANKMMSGQDFIDAAFSEEDKELIKKTESEFPSKTTMLSNFGKEMWNSAKRAGRGLPVLASPEKAEERYDICKGCEFLTQPQARCTKCGCFMKTKVNLEASTCPVGKW